MSRTPKVEIIRHIDGSELACCTVKAVCDRLCLGRTTVFSLMSSNKIQRVKSGRRSLIIIQSVDEYIAKLIAEQRGSDGPPSAR